MLEVSGAEELEWEAKCLDQSKNDADISKKEFHFSIIKVKQKIK